MDASTPSHAPWLLRTEARGIQRYIVATNRLVEITGASALVERLPERASALAAELGGLTLTSAAGAATLGFPDEASCARFAEWWPLVCVRHAPGLQVTAAWAGPTEGDHRVHLLREKLDMAQQRLGVELPEAGPMVARAGRTGRAAVTRGDRPGRRDWLDRETAAKLRDEGDDPVGDRFLGPAHQGWTFTRETQALGADGMAVVHIDGDGLGQRMLGLSDADYVAFSRALRAAMETAAQAATARLVDLETRRLKREGPLPATGSALPARPVVLGGDDCALLVRASDALAFVEGFLTELEAQGAASVFGSQGLTATAGIAIVHDHTPFYEAHRLARDLCDAAKDSKRASKDSGSSLLFHRVTTSALAPWSAVLTQELAGGRTETLPDGLAGGPYGLRGPRRLQDLIALAQALRLLPRGPVREWARLALREPARAQVRWQRLREVAAGRGVWHGVEAGLTALGADPETGLARDGRSTPVLDAHTLGRLAPDLAGGAR